MLEKAWSLNLIVMECVAYKTSAALIIYSALRIDMRRSSRGWSLSVMRAFLESVECCSRPMLRVRSRLKNW
jgi:hypothetical protein